MSDDMDPVVKRLYSTTDAYIWAEEFMKIINQPGFQIDHGFMLGWFANAMEIAAMAAEKKMKERPVEGYLGLYD